jgi:hypothetical protein
MLLPTKTSKNSMRQDFSQKPRTEIPGTHASDAVAGKAHRQLPDDGFNGTTQLVNQRRNHLFLPDGTER